MYCLIILKARVQWREPMLMLRPWWWILRPWSTKIARGFCCCGSVLNAAFSYHCCIHIFVWMSFFCGEPHDEHPKEFIGDYVTEFIGDHDDVRKKKIDASSMQYGWQISVFFYSMCDLSMVVYCHHTVFRHYNRCHYENGHCEFGELDIFSRVVPLDQATFYSCTDSSLRLRTMM